MIPHPALMAHHIFNDNRRKQMIDDLLQGTMHDTWITSTGNELGHLADGISGCVKGSSTIGFIKKSCTKRKEGHIC
eukprot:4687437-Ditylum_brightwellii.AAC.1